MTSRRSRGDGGVHWDEKRQRWIGTVTVGFTPAGRRITRKCSDPNVSKAREKLRKLIQRIEDGDTAKEVRGYTVANAARDFVTHGLNNRDKATVDKIKSLVETHIVPDLGARALGKLTADDVDDWLLDKASVLATRTLGDLRSILRRAINRAQRREKVKRNVVLLCDELPTGTDGRKSKALTLVQARAVLAAANESKRWRCYVVVSLLTGARTEELRGLLWSDVDLHGDLTAEPSVPPHIDVIRSVRSTGDTKTKKSRRSLALPELCVEVLSAHREAQQMAQEKAGDEWRATGLVFTTRFGTALDAANVRRGFRTVVKAAGLPPLDWVPRELRHSFVSVLSDAGVSIEHISRLVGHAGSTVTESVYRHQIRPVIDHNTAPMNQLFPATKP
ncbi:MAG: site-specific integrase [Actinomycetota bacterium]|nr:site-specific integrase [Actinomycetota bacterium]